MSMSTSPVELLDQSRVAHNDLAVHSMRIVAGLAGGSAAGMLGLTSIAGLVFFLFVSALVSIAVFVAIGSTDRPSFTSTWCAIRPGLFQSALTFILFWTFVYNVIYIY